MTDPWLGDSMAPMPAEPKPERAEYQPVRVSMLGNIASGLIVVVAALSVFYTWTSWNTYGVLQDVLSSPFTAEPETRVQASDNLVLIAVWGYRVFVVGAAVVFLIWLWRARQNAEGLSEGLHTRSRGWVLGGWFVPIVAWWFPYQVVRDVWRASDPGTRTLAGELRLARGSALVGVWWSCWLVFSIAGTLSFNHARREPTGDEGVDEILTWFQGGAVYDTVSTVGEVLAAVLIVLIIRRISAWQEVLGPAAQREG